MMKYYQIEFARFEGRAVGQGYALCLLIRGRALFPVCLQLRRRSSITTRASLTPLEATLRAWKVRVGQNHPGS